MATEGQMQAIADWHGEQAAKAYRENDTDAFIRHTMIADRLWARREARKVRAA